MTHGGSATSQPLGDTQIRGEFVDTHSQPEPEFDLGRAPQFDRYATEQPGTRRALIWGSLLLLLAVAAGGAYYYWFHYRALEPAAQPPPVADAPPAATTPVEPAIKHPIGDARPEAGEPVAAAVPPSLEDSDKAVADALAGVVGRSALERFASLSGFVRRFVATVDNLPRKKAPQRMWPFTQTAGPFETTGGGDAIYVSAANAQRYEPALRMLESADTGKLVALYVQLYPLFQQAYRELGYPNGYFNDRLVEVIDDLLATPDVAGPVKLARPWVMYEFADPALEARSAGQKTLIRMGPENAARVKAKLREIRRQVTGRALPQ